MNKFKRTAVGFLIAPMVPGALLYVYGLAKGYGTAALVGPLLLVPVAYFAAFVIGIPMYRYLERKGIRRLPSYLISGGLIGASFDLIFNFPTIYSYQSLPLGEVYVATIYAALSAAVFWSLAVRGMATG
jgi:hypothetical protein